MNTTAEQNTIVKVVESLVKARCRGKAYDACRDDIVGDATVSVLTLHAETDGHVHYNDCVQAVEDARQQHEWLPRKRAAILRRNAALVASRRTTTYTLTDAQYAVLTVAVGKLDRIHQQCGPVRNSWFARVETGTVKEATKSKLEKME